MPKTHTLVKICGLTSEEQALQVAKLGAHAIGIISVEDSPTVSYTHLTLPTNTPV